MAEVAAPIMLRAKITPDEWTRLRKLALDRKVAVSLIVGELIREFVDLHDPKPVGDQ